MAAPDGHEGIRLTLWDATQAPHTVRDGVAAYLGLEPKELRVVTPDVGGGFGPRGRIYAEEYVVAALALRHQCPISFTATRTEDLLTTAQGGGLTVQARLAATRNGLILGIDHHIVQDAGAYTAGGLSASMNTMRHLLGPYRVPAARIQVTGVYTNRVMTSPLRGGGRQNGIFVMERLLDRLAERLQVDCAEIRRRNFIPSRAFPYDTGLPSAGGASMVYDSASFPTYLDRALDIIDRVSFQREQETARQQGRYLGLGLAAFIESTGVGGEEAQLRLEQDGRVAVRVGSPGQGQGHATAFTQMAADRLGVSFDLGPLSIRRYRPGDDSALRGGPRLRHAHQSNHRRRTGARWCGARHRQCSAGGVRRRRPGPSRQPHLCRLSAAQHRRCPHAGGSGRGNTVTV